MTSIALLESLRAREVVITADGDRLTIDAPPGALTEEDRARLREHKSELLALLRIGATLKATERPRLGSIARPVVVRGAGMPMSCLWTACDGLLKGQGGDRYLCATCSTWFELLAPETGFVYVGDLADDFDAGDATEWVM